MRLVAEAEAPRPRLRDALLLGVMHGPAELLPISSSGHTTLVPWLLGLEYSELSASDRKPIEIALHAGTAAALTISPPPSPITTARGARGAALAATTLLPTSLIGLAARKFVRTRLGTPMTVAIGLVAGSAALIAADRSSGSRQADSETLTDALLLGVAQSAALWPGVSRSTSMLCSARALGFEAGDAARIARAGLIPAAAAATTLETVEIARSGITTQEAAVIAVAAGSSFASTMLARPLVRVLESGGTLKPWATWRLLVAAATILRIRSLGKDRPR